MGSPLDELRKVSNQVEKKKEENIKHAKDKQQLEKEMLSENTLEQKRLREINSQKAVKRTQTIKLTVVLCSMLFVAGLLFFIFKFVIFGANTLKEEVEFASDGYITLDATTEEYNKVNTFITRFTDRYKSSPSKTKIPWYTHLPEGKKIRYTKVLKAKLNFPGVEFKRIKENKEREIFEVIYNNGEDVSLTFNIIENNEEKLKIVKIF